MKAKKLHIDGGGEHNGHFTPILKTPDIRHQPPPPQTRECNRKVEHLGCTLNGMVHATNMPNSFWAEAMRTATYLCKRPPTAAINDAIPHERWFNTPLRSQDLKILKPFGCMAWNEAPKQDRSRTHGIGKYMDRRMRGCFLGYLSSTTFRTTSEMELPQPSDFFDEPGEAFTWPSALETDDSNRQGHCPAPCISTISTQISASNT